MLNKSISTLPLISRDFLHLCGLFCCLLTAKQYDSSSDESALLVLVSENCSLVPCKELTDLLGVALTVTLPGVCAETDGKLSASDSSGVLGLAHLDV